MMARAISISSDDARWQRESDARTLSEAKVIMSDPKRLKGAATAAGKMAKEKHEEAKAMSAVAKKAPKAAVKPSKKSGKK